MDKVTLNVYATFGDDEDLALSVEMVRGSDDPSDPAYHMLYAPDTHKTLFGHTVKIEVVDNAGYDRAVQVEQANGSVSQLKQ